MIDLTQLRVDSVAARLIRLAETLKELGAFMIITLGVTINKMRRSTRATHPLLYQQIWRSGVRLLPIGADAADPVRPGAWTPTS